MLLRRLDLTTALRPTLSPDEALLFVQNGVGLYEGKEKLANFQNGHIYLTSHRLCYVDNHEPRKHAVAIALKEVDHGEFHAGFLKASPKVSIYAKEEVRRPPYRALTSSNGHDSPAAANLQSADGVLSQRSLKSHSSRPPATDLHNATWICPICSYSNQLPPDFDLGAADSRTSTPACQNCGVQPEHAHILKAAIAKASGSSTSRQDSPFESKWSMSHHGRTSQTHHAATESGFTVDADSTLRECPRCTYLNHPSVLSCEICGAPFALPPHSQHGARAASYFDRKDSEDAFEEREAQIIKISFRVGGDKACFDKLKGALIQRKWLLSSAPPIPESSSSSHVVGHGGDTHAVGDPDGLQAPSKLVGIAGLERRGLAITKKNENMLGTAFEDLDALMASAKEVIALAENFARSNNGSTASEAGELIAESASGLDMIITKDMLGHGAGSEALYLAELSRHLAEYLTDNSKGVLKHEGGIMTLVDLWAVFNRSRGGIELISPSDFEKAAGLWEQLKLPVRMRQFKNGVFIVQHANRTDDKTIAQLLTWLESIRLTSQPMDAQISIDVATFGACITAQEAAQHFGWSVGVASEELAMAEEHGALCRDHGVEGIKYWENWLIKLEHDGPGDDLVLDGSALEQQQQDELLQGLKDTGLL